VAASVNLSGEAGICLASRRLRRTIGVLILGIGSVGSLLRISDLTTVVLMTNQFTKPCCKV